jgi:hypothetical protein
MGSLLSGYVTIRDSTMLLEHFDQLASHVGAGASGAVMGLGAALTIWPCCLLYPIAAFLDKNL